MATSDAFPSATYAKYKRATAYFLRWLLRARLGGVGVGAIDASTLTHPLDAYERIVADIATEPTALSPSLLQSYPHALEACESAITLRERVALFLGESADDAHAHFLDRLKSWFRSLKTAYSLPTRSHSKPPSCSRSNGATLDFSNYYAVLALPEDYFAQDEEDIAVVSETRPRISPVGQQQLLDAVFAQDLNAQLAFFFMELEELSEGVYAAFFDVKQQKTTLFEASAVAKVAIDSAERVIASLQVKYPSIRDGEDISTVIRDRLTLLDLDRLVGRVVESWKPREGESEKTPRYRYVPGTILVDMLWAASSLLAFGTQIRKDPSKRYGIGQREERYSEDNTTYHTVPDPAAAPTFFFFFLHAAACANPLPVGRASREWVGGRQAYEGIHGHVVPQSFR